MSIASFVDTPATQPISLAVSGGPWQRLYRQLLEEPVPGHALARSFIEECLHEAQHLSCDLPPTVQALPAWSVQHSQAVSAEYATYLAGRKSGEGRRYFTGHAHALHFLRSVAPTKLVDGAWLYGTLPHWRDNRLYPLVRTYLEELGDGVAAQNHVCLYRRLLATQGCDDLGELDDALYRQGAIQLALGLLTEDYLPEVIGYNLGYEQLPLHLLITAFELNELGIDPYYFQLHVTIDNSASGHAAKAVQSVLENLPRVGDTEAFYRRVMRGYCLNELAVGSTAVIESFDLERELLQALERKRSVASQMHSDYCRIEGRTVNQWLADDNGMVGFLDALQRHGWIRRDRDPANSRFWRLIQGEGASMFGVFSRYERHLLHDWIAGDWRQDSPQNPFRRRHPTAIAQLPSTAHQRGELDRERRDLLVQLNRLDTSQREARLIELQAPAHHASTAGLAATRTFAALAQQAR
ncbi:heme oxygenase-like protein [Ectopseudomonas oleovorans]|uniref:Heme oxygenase-like protein n=1 Tax=Ectopseudomonas oleovorans TaxID=301 RepID=A0A397NL88_ECTOL|nr:iron-containing redox enzyme family protein [Pseudomonas oleovorans]RIA35997.1 heme oxygenase-like protein [Pseudomonas oleovorans]